MKKRYVVMAKDQKAIEAIDYDIATPDQILEIELTQDELDFFFTSGLVDELNRVCKVIIDDFEDEKIVGKPNLNEAIAVLKRYRYSFPSRAFFENLLALFQGAASKDTAIFFFF